MTRKRAADLLNGLDWAIYNGEALAWCVEHAADGDPIPAAWAQCRDAFTMVSLLVTAHGFPPRTLTSWPFPLANRRRPMRLVETDAEKVLVPCGPERRHACRRLRRRVRPTLAWLLACAAEYRR